MMMRSLTLARMMTRRMVRSHSFSLALPRMADPLCAPLTADEGDVKDASTNYLDLLAQAQVSRAALGFFIFVDLADSLRRHHRPPGKQEAKTTRMRRAPPGVTRCFGHRRSTRLTPTRASPAPSLVRPLSVSLGSR